MMHLDKHRELCAECRKDLCLSKSYESLVGGIRLCESCFFRELFDDFLDKNLLLRLIEDGFQTLVIRICNVSLDYLVEFKNKSRVDIK